jgi:RND family efflux transporter MFP subunit
MNSFSVRNSICAITFSLLAVLLVAGCSRGNEKKAVYEKKPVRVKVESVKRGVLTRVLNYKGTVFPWLQANIGPDISGRIKKIYKKPGDTVQKDELLAELDITTITLQANQAEAALEAAKAAHKDALLNFQRLKKLFEKNAVSQMQLEKAELALEAAQTNEQSAAAGFEVIKHNLKNSIMRAPFSGIITSKNMEEGDVINPMMGMNAGILTLMDLRKVKIILDIPSGDIEKIAVGQSCKVKVDTLPDDIFAGAVYSKNLAADIASKTFKVEVEVNNPDIAIKVGIFAEVEIEVSRIENALLLPAGALMTEGDTNYVILFNQGTAKFRNVRIGRSNDRFFEILDGLQEDQHVIVEGNYDLKENTAVTMAKDSD